MPMVRCPAGEHFYDNELHKECPYCLDENYVPSQSGGGGGRKTELNPGMGESTPQGAQPGRKTEIIPGGSSAGSSAAGKPSGAKTVMISPSSGKSDEGSAPADSGGQEFNPMVGWLVIVEGPGKGNDLKIYNGFNTIGRGSGNRIVLNFGDMTVTENKHASLLYDHEENKFFVAHNEGKALTKVNGKLVAGLTELASYDRIKIGETIAMFVPLCGDNFTW